MPSRRRLIFWWPVNRPVSRTTSRAIRSGCSTASRIPIGPPQSWTTDRGTAEVEILEKRRRQLDVAVVGVPVDVGRLVGAPEAGQVGGQAAKAGVAHRRDHLAPQERPGRLAVEEDDRRALALVDVRQPQPVDLAVMRLEREVGKTLEALVGCPDRLYGHARLISARL